MSPSFVEDLRQPEHTGENRCWPCTAVNVVILGTVAAALSVASPALSVATAAVGLLLIGVRGYLLPGTPRFAPALVARIPGGDALFDHAADRTSGSLSADGNASEPDDAAVRDDAADAGAATPTKPDPTAEGDESAAVPEDDALLDRLVDAGVLAADEETVAPTAAFEERWDAAMAELREADTEALADAALEFSPAAESQAISESGEEWVALAPHADTNAIEETWLSRPVAIAEVGGARAAAAFVDDDATALAAAQTSRLFLDACPDCGTALERGTEMDCCGGHTGPNDVPRETLVCPSCEVRLYTFE